MMMMYIYIYVSHVRVCIIIIRVIMNDYFSIRNNKNMSIVNVVILTHTADRGQRCVAIITDDDDFKNKK